MEVGKNEKSNSTIYIPIEEYEELLLFKKLVENNLTKDIIAEELKLIKETRKAKSMSKEFLK
ncbi:MAG: hypothetical protein JXB48_21560 [Candidatus Latescibacteria bacterium]|nr:hypothetical protein [Candidatus Latescibacterota bacterium]